MVEIAHAGADRAEEIAQFMNTVFPKAKWDINKWRALMDARWSRPGDSIAVTVRDKGNLVGVLGLVTAERPTSEGVGITANMTSWYLRKPYRGRGIGRQMIEAATADPRVTVTNFSSARNAVPVVQRAGLVPLDETRLIWHPAGKGKLRIYHEALAVDSELSDRDRQILEDHAGLDVTPLAVETPDGLCPLILAIKRKSDAYVTYEVLYTGDRALLAAHIRDIADSILPPSNAILSVDSRFLPADMRSDARETIPVPRFYTPGQLRPEEVDMLYSEIVLLGLKLY